jgi:hypothetical protein
LKHLFHKSLLTFAIKVTTSRRLTRATDHRTKTD